MNEFRQFLGLKQFKTFEEWNPDPEIASAARRLYGHIDNLELYAGLQCEESMPLKPDAIALVRGDRYFSTDFTSRNLTAWGYRDCQRDPHNGGFGGELPKLLMRHFPRHYPSNSIYGCFPFFIPEKMRQSLTAQGLSGDYRFERPTPTREVKILNTCTGIKYVLNDPARFPTVYDMKGGGYGFFLCFDEAAQHSPDRAQALHALFPSDQSLTEYREWYRESTIQKIKERSWTYDGLSDNYIDIVKSVINATSVHWAADRLCGLPLKTKDHPEGLYTEHEIYDMHTVTYTFIGIGESEAKFSQRWAAIQAGGVLQALVAKSVLQVAPESEQNFLMRFISRVSNFFCPPSRKAYYPFLHKPAESGLPINELVANVIGIAVGSSVNYAQAAVHVVDFYLSDTRAQERIAIIELVKRDDSNSVETLYGYVREAMRLNPQYGGRWRDVAADSSIPQGPELPALEFEDLTAPNFLRIAIGLPESDGRRPLASTITEIVKVVFGLKNVRRVPGAAGSLAGFQTIVNETQTNIYLTPYETTSPWPGSMYLVYDD
ncbi:hypothetical protein B0H17DRAFT_1219696 [Mycena rosella]|uniref:Uncharacterized protein n=1 Tax=Mycena rosella TaxID=1033263 RepID=A0AAD7FEU1_MYCRO|nr:hypothetical protein B0H17DRAFT_1219696 [Mycena rosella]